MSASYELQKTIYDALVADAGVGAFVGDRIFDGAPAARDFPNITFGPSDEITDDADCIPSENHVIQLDVWSRDQGRLNPCKKIVDAVKAALHETSLSLADPHALVEMRVTSKRVFKDADGITAHGVVIVEAIVEV